MIGKKLYKKNTLMAFMFPLALGMATNVQAITPSYTHTSGSAPIGVVLPAVVPTVTSTWGPGCASVIFRLTSLLGNVWFDAIAPYTATAVGVASDLGRRPESESIDKSNRNIAIIYASYRLLLNEFPLDERKWRNMMREAKLNPDNNERNTTTPAGIGNMAGDAVVARANADGMNSQGTSGGCTYNCLPFQDTTGYKPVNTVYEVVDASKWAPWMTTTGNGIFTSQTFVTPQYSQSVAYSYTDPSVFSAPDPIDSDPANVELYKAQADEVLARSAALAVDDRLKVQAELFDNKFRGYAGAIGQTASSNKLPLNTYVQYYFTANLAAYDAGIAAWHEKYRFDSVRPYTAIPHIYGDEHVTAWGGIGKGLVTDMPASEWRQYLNVADHPEYPSGSGIFCAAIAQSSRRFFNDDGLNFTTTYTPGTSLIEPGITPVSSITLAYPTWTEWENTCFQARVDGGVHFRASVAAAPRIRHPFAVLANVFVLRHIYGNPPPETDEQNRKYNARCI